MSHDDDDDILEAVCRFQLDATDATQVPLVVVSARVDRRYPADPGPELLARLHALHPNLHPHSARGEGRPPPGALMLDNGPVTHTGDDTASVEGAPAVPGGANRLYRYDLERTRHGWIVTSSTTLLMT